MARQKRQIGDSCPNGHLITAENALMRSGSVACRQCWNAYVRERNAGQRNALTNAHAEIDALRHAIAAMRTRHLLDDVKISEPEPAE